MRTTRMRTPSWRTMTVHNPQRKQKRRHLTYAEWGEIFPRCDGPRPTVYHTPQEVMYIAKNDLQSDPNTRSIYMPATASVVGRRNLLQKDKDKERYYLHCDMLPYNTQRSFPNIHLPSYDFSYQGTRCLSHLTCSSFSIHTHSSAWPDQNSP